MTFTSTRLPALRSNLRHSALRCTRCRVFPALRYRSASVSMASRPEWSATPGAGEINDHVVVVLPRIEPLQKRRHRPEEQRAGHCVDGRAPVVLPRTSTRMCLACSQANTRADTMTPTTTATARSVATVTADTRINTSASLRGTLPRHPETTPLEGADDHDEHHPDQGRPAGICSIRGDATRMNSSRNSSAAVQCPTG